MITEYASMGILGLLLGSSPLMSEQIMEEIMIISM